MTLKYLLVLVVVVGVLWLMWRSPAGDAKASRRPGRRRGPPTMVACAHCGVHLPPGDALNDAGGRAYCSEAHRLAGPR